MLYLYGYVLYVGLAYSRSTIDQPNTRMLAPILPLLVVLCMRGAERLIGTRHLPPRLMGGLAIGVLCLSAYRFVDTTSDVRASTDGYQSARWAQSATLAQARHLRGAIFSNAPDVIWLHTGRGARITPCDRYCPWDRTSTVDQLTEGSFVVWFDEPALRSYLVPLDELVSKVGLREVKRLEDGAIYQVVR